MVGTIHAKWASLNFCAPFHPVKNVNNTEMLKLLAHLEGLSICLRYFPSLCITVRPWVLFCCCPVLISRLRTIKRSFVLSQRGCKEGWQKKQPNNQTKKHQKPNAKSRIIMFCSCKPLELGLTRPQNQISCFCERAWAERCSVLLSSWDTFSSFCYHYLLPKQPYG